MNRQILPSATIETVLRATGPSRASMVAMLYEAPLGGQEQVAADLVMAALGAFAEATVGDA